MNCLAAGVPLDHSVSADTILYGRLPRQSADAATALLLPQKLATSALSLDTRFQIEYGRQVWSGCRYWLARGALPDSWELPTLDKEMSRRYRNDNWTYLQWLAHRSKKVGLLSQSREVIFSSGPQPDQAVFSPCFDQDDLALDPRLSKDCACLVSTQMMKAVETIAMTASGLTADQSENKVGEWRLLRTSDRDAGLDLWELTYFVDAEMRGSVYAEQID